MLSRRGGPAAGGAPYGGLLRRAYTEHQAPAALMQRWLARQGMYLMSQEGAAD